LLDDVFVLTPTANGVLTSAAKVVADTRRWVDALTARGAILRLRSQELVAGTSPSGQTVWVFDQVIAEAVRDGAILCSVPVRLTALRALESDWSIASAYWSVPFPTQAEQDTTSSKENWSPGRCSMRTSRPTLGHSLTP
jgi:hypothetical protein